MQAILSKHPDVFDNTVGKLEDELNHYMNQDVTPAKAASRDILLSEKNNFIVEFKDIQDEGNITRMRSNLR